VKPERIARQSGHPSGWFGEIVARVMAFDTLPANRIAERELGLRAGEAVIEVGCGSGWTLRRLAASGAGFLAGVDGSEVMVRLARRRLRRRIAEGNAEVSLATSDALPYPAASFDAALAVHVVYFWANPLADLREIHRVLRPGGRVLLGYRPRDEQAEAALPASVYTLRTIGETVELLQKAGFETTSSTTHPLGGGVYTEAGSAASACSSRGR